MTTTRETKTYAVNYDGYNYSVDSVDDVEQVMQEVVS